MDKIDLDAQLVLFKSWAMSVGWAKAQLIINNSGGFPLMQVQAAWEGWQAALASQALAAQTPAVCTVPPPGWRCTRVAGHDGPCAAVPE